MDWDKLEKELLELKYKLTDDQIRYVRDWFDGEVDRLEIDYEQEKLWEKYAG